MVGVGCRGKADGATKLTDAEFVDAAVAVALVAENKPELADLPSHLLARGISNCVGGAATGEIQVRVRQVGDAIVWDRVVFDSAHFDIVCIRRMFETTRLRSSIDASITRDFVLTRRTDPPADASHGPLRIVTAEWFDDAGYYLELEPR